MRHWPTFADVCRLESSPLTEYQRCVTVLGEDGGEFGEVFAAWNRRRFPSLASIIQGPLHELPQIVFTLRAVQQPASIPMSLASLNIITSTSESFSGSLMHIFFRIGSISENFATVRKMYEVINLQNRILDGTIPYPQNQQALQMGMSIEFRNVCFQYPESNAYALKNISFKIGQGQLCVILGENGSGKSTILKLIARLYEPQEGEILIDGQDIKTLKLADLRQAMAVLFQDYTHFPLSIKENIALGDPGHSDDLDRIKQAAKLGGASELIERLGEGYNTYLDRPVRDYYSGLPEGTTNLFGRPVSFGRVRAMGGMKINESTTLSGGQMQRIALSRTFMRSLVSETSVGLLLFDEPSASLDPTAEHGILSLYTDGSADLFERLRLLRGQKTMIFSSHRFGSLTRHADKILCMHDSVIVEEGSHDELIKGGGEYAKLWNLQAQAFL
ncbi:P-loop containing nucleoside triphosphate hydrolase protein [Gymnopus androsaceus JB14]|uniref:P-loop containing nucleoside triphosphate hydrolase protein n=1 Tax=Gymnopus androsaceus JB14 TaxID=1447944 RepID=A0A6A4GZW3_9AGAR|nr:P-loop containing nucleoside triphosphate hydrolase protein [Gymnopus androsaceus JB14]